MTSDVRVINELVQRESAFIDAIFPQLEAGKDEVAFAFSEERLNAWPELYKTSFARLNP